MAHTPRFHLGQGRVIKQIAVALFCFVFVGIGLVGAMYAIGSAIETVGQHQDEQRMCLRGARNGFEIERCK